MKTLTKLQQLLQELFQFDCQELDFGIYRVLNEKRKQVERFINERLPETVDEAFADYAAADREAAERELERKRQEIVSSLGPSAFEPDGQLALAFRETPLGKQFHRLRQEARAVQVAQDLKDSVCNDLHTFFSRYYEDGDIFSKPRRGKVEIPFTGHEDVVLHWANKDQYYIKTGEQFKCYRFIAGDAAVEFALRRAATEQNNNRGEKRYFVLAAESPVTLDEASRVLTVFFEYRPLTSQEKDAYGKNENQRPQDKLNAEAEQAILKRVANPALKARLAQPTSPHNPSLLLRELTRFTRKNTTDFFIHKNLRGFLTGELDDFLKSEVLKTDELLATDPEVGRRALLRAQVVRRIATDLIDFVSQVEDFQKKLFEKRKFVLRTEYCVTLDRLPGALWQDVLENEGQLAEWRQLYALDDLLKAAEKKKPDLQFLKAHDKLVVDTRHFPEDFKWRLLAGFDDLDAALDGLLIKSENFQALALLLAKYRERVKCIYVDPPYNTGGTEFVYKNNYRHSSWAAMIEQVLLCAAQTLLPDGLAAVAIDDFEQPRLANIIEDIFGESGRLGTLAVEIKPSGRTNDKFLATCHEFYLFTSRNPDRAAIAFFELTDEHKAAYREEEGGVRFKWRDFLRTGGYSTPEQRPNSFYPIYFNRRTAWIGLQQKTGAIEIWPIDSEGRKRVWRKTPPSFAAHVQAGDIKIKQAGGGVWKVYIKDREKPGMRPKSVWCGARYDAATYGTKLLKDLFGAEKAFDFPKSVHAVEDILHITTDEGSGLVLDFFAGSGTTAHAAINRNREHGSSLKYVLVELAEYFDTVILPRLKKVVFCSEWKDGKPAGGEGVSHLLKYQVLEQYEDALNNLDRPRAQEGELALKTYGDEYLLRYMLDFETQGSAPLLAVEKLPHPFSYKLRVQAGDEQVERTVDMVETFNYLLGLHVKKLRKFRDGKRPYRATLGEARNGQSVVVVWRDAQGLESGAEALQQDRRFIETEVLPTLLGEDAKPGRLLVNQPCSEDAEPIEPEFKRLMFAPIG